MLSPQKGEGFFVWSRGGLREEVDQLRIEVDQVRAENAALRSNLKTVTSAAVFSMAYQLERHKTLRDADFPVGYTLSDVAGKRHALTQEHKDALITATARAEALYIALSTQ